MTGWREGQAAQYDFYVAELDKLLAELDNAEAICDALGADVMASESRGYAGGIRALRNDLHARARDLRSAAEPWQVLPISLTTRHVRGVE
jgi:hypothetical protein